MRVLIYEHVCGGGLVQQPLPQELAQSGAGMLQAVVEDFVDAGCDVVTTCDPRSNLKLPHSRVEVIPIRDHDDLEIILKKASREAHAALIVAPETGGTLLHWARCLQHWDVPSLGSTPSAIELCSNKHATALHLKAKGVQTPETRYGQAEQLLTWLRQMLATHRAAYVLKPADGVGSENIHVLRVPADVPRLAALNLQGNWIVQRLIVGRSFSVSFMMNPRQQHTLKIGEQFITGHERLQYEGGIIPAKHEHVDETIATKSNLAFLRAMKVAKDAVRCTAGLHGFVGVDLVLEESTSMLWVIEINPRLTVSYCGLRQLSVVNLAAAMLQQAVPDSWHAQTVQFDSAGRITEAMR